MGEKTYTEGGGVRAPPLPVISEWIINSWNEIKIETIVKSFKKCGISNALDGTEDDYLWNDRDEDDIDDLQPMISEDDDDPYDDIIQQDDCEAFFSGDNVNNNMDNDKQLCDFSGF